MQSHISKDAFVNTDVSWRTLKSNLSTSDEYDAAVFCGGLAQGHIKLDVFPDIIRIVKNGTCPPQDNASKKTKVHQTSL